MEKIIKKGGKIYLQKRDLSFGVWHTTMTEIGTYEENEEKPKETKSKKKRIKKEED